MSTKDLRYNLLKLLRDYTITLKMPIPLESIVAHFPKDSYKNVQVQLTALKAKSFIATNGPRGNYTYYITKSGLKWLDRLELIMLRQRMIETFNEELDLYNSYT